MEFRRPRTILLIEDQAHLRASTRRWLENHGLQVVELSSGVGAEDVVRTRCIDLVVTDMAMPERGGVETIRHLRQMRDDLPIVVVTGGALGGLASRIGVERTLPKPVDPELLCETIDELLLDA